MGFTIPPKEQAMHHNHIKTQQVTKEHAIYIVGDEIHDYLVEKVLAMKKSTHREFVDSLGNQKFLRFVPFSDEVKYFIDDGKI
jgi:hypothetical protein